MCQTGALSSASTPCKAVPHIIPGAEHLMVSIRIAVRLLAVFLASQIEDITSCFVDTSVIGRQIRDH